LNGVNPAGLSLLVDKGQPETIPIGSYDVGDGYYNPETGEICTYDGKKLRMPEKAEAATIVERCRRGVLPDGAN
jgi:hypothetical protein